VVEFFTRQQELEQIKDYGDSRVDVPPLYTNKLNNMPTYLENEKLGPYLKLIDLNLLGHIIKRLRRSKRWTQQKLANEAALEASYISHIEKGRKLISIPVISNLADALGVSAVCLTTLCVKDDGLPHEIAQAQRTIQSEMWKVIFPGPDTEPFAEFYKQASAVRPKKRVKPEDNRKGCPSQ